MRTLTSTVCAGLAAFLMLLFVAQGSSAQTHAVPSRITAPVDDTVTVQLKGNIHPLARPEFDRGVVPDSQPMSRMLLLLQRSPGQETALQLMIDAQQTKGSASYHTWLTPEQFGQQFGPSDEDMQAVTDWLTHQGFQIAKVAAGRNAIEFSGNVAQVRTAFHTDIHKYSVNGVDHIANATEPSIPAALSPVVRGVVALHNFPHRSQLRNKGVYRLQRDTGKITPLYTYGDPANFALAPADFNKVYNVPVGADGTGQTIAVVGVTNINAQDIIDFRKLFGLPQNFTQANNVIVNGPDPGIIDTGDEGEADLDVEWAGAVAPNATVLLVVTSGPTESNPTQVTQPDDLSALYIIDNNIASVMTDSYGECEPNLGAAANAFYNQLWEQAAAEGITVAVATGDTGSASCDAGSNLNAATDGTTVNGIASTPYNVGVGGTDFDASAQPVVPPNAYWSAQSGNTQFFGSVLQYIAETAWDDSTCAAIYPQPCTGVDSQGADLSAGGGGPSNCGIWSGSNCQSGYPIPAYQMGANILTVRTIPDVSFFASNGGNGVALIVCQADVAPQDGNSCGLSTPYTDFGLVGGTSAAAPSFAGIMALVNQYESAHGGLGRQGNANFVLYGLAGQDPNYKNGNCNSSVLGTLPTAGCVFNDVTVGNNAVACIIGSTSNVDNKTTSWCAGTGATYGVTVTGTSVAYSASKGYDLATGLGSINVTNLLNKWSSFNRTATTTTVKNLSGGAQSGQNFKATITVSPSSATGNVSITALAADKTTILASIAGANSGSNTSPFTLSGGSVNIQTNLLPPGTAYVSAYYTGDVNNAASASTPVALAAPVAGANYNTKVSLSATTFNSNTGAPIFNTGSLTTSYGSSYILSIFVSNGTGCGFSQPATLPSLPCPTGSVALTDTSTTPPTPINDFPSGPTFNATNMAKLVNQGLVEDAYVQLPGGTHKLLATYTSGDSNYQSGPSNTVTVTITPAATALQVTSNLSTITSGQTVTLTALVSSGSNSSQGPTGTVQFTSNGSNLGTSVACNPTGANLNTNVGAYCTATLPNVAISALYPPSTRGTPPVVPLIPALIGVLSILLFALGWRWMPENRRRAYAYAGLLAFALLAAGLAGCGGGGSSSHTVTISATYAGDTNYAAPSSTTTATITVQ